MADILIKGLDLPKDDEVTVLTIQSDGRVNVFGKRLLSLLRPTADVHGLRTSITTAVALPEHELISVHKVLDYLAERAETSKEMGDDETASLFASMGGDILAMSVEASNGYNN